VTVIAGPPDFLDDVRMAAQQLGVTDRVAFAADLPVAS
jgi:hypothetical protein